MFLGHIGVGLAAKQITPKVPLGVLIPVALLPDLLAIPGIILANPALDPVIWTHSLMISIIWSVVAVLTAALFSRNFGTGLVIGLLVLSHWILDFFTWPMENGVGLPLLFDRTQQVGLGLYSTTMAIKPKQRGYYLFSFPA